MCVILFCGIRNLCCESADANMCFLRPISCYACTVHVFKLAGCLYSLCCSFTSFYTQHSLLLFYSPQSVNAIQSTPSLCCVVPCCGTWVYVPFSCFQQQGLEGWRNPGEGNVCTLPALPLYIVTACRRLRNATLDQHDHSPSASLFPCLCIFHIRQVCVCSAVASSAPFASMATWR